MILSPNFPRYPEAILNFSENSFIERYTTLLTLLIIAYTSGADILSSAPVSDEDVYFEQPADCARAENPSTSEKFGNRLKVANGKYTLSCRDLAILMTFMRI